MAIVDDVREVLVQQLHLKPEQIVPEAQIREQLGVDSLDVIDLSLALEEKFSVDISDEEAQQARTVADIVSAIEQKLKEKAKQSA